MAEDLPDAAFWLPSDFLTDADILSDFSVSAPDSGTSLDDDLRDLNSPQSTLFAFESNNPGSSLDSPNDKKKDDSATLDLLNKAAGEVAKMKVTSKSSNGTGFFDGSYSGERQFYPPQQPQPLFYRHNAPEMMRGPAAPKKQQQSKVTKKNNKNNNGNDRTLGLPQSAWPPLPGKAQSQAQAQVQPMTGSYIVLKRESVGTGVFLPRHDVGSPAQSKNKSEGISMKTKSDKSSQRRNFRQAKTNQDDIRLPPEWVY